MAEERETELRRRQAAAGRRLDALLEVSVPISAGAALASVAALAVIVVVPTTLHNASPAWVTLLVLLGAVGGWVRSLRSHRRH